MPLTDFFVDFDLDFVLDLDLDFVFDFFEEDEDPSSIVASFELCVYYTCLNLSLTISLFISLLTSLFKSSEAGAYSLSFSFKNSISSLSFLFIIP